MRLFCWAVVVVIIVVVVDDVVFVVVVLDVNVVAYVTLNIDVRLLVMKVEFGWAGVGWDGWGGVVCKTIFVSNPTQLS